MVLANRSLAKCKKPGAMPGFSFSSSNAKIGSEFRLKIAVYLKADADFDEDWSCPGRSAFYTAMGVE